MPAKPPKKPLIAPPSGSRLGANAKVRVRGASLIAMACSMGKNSAKAGKKKDAKSEAREEGQAAGEQSERANQQIAGASLLDSLSP